MRFTLPLAYSEIRIVVKIKGRKLQEKTVRADVGNVTFTFNGGTGGQKDKDEEPGGGMEAELLGTLGKIAGLAGVSVGVVLLIFKDVLKQKLIPKADLTPNQAFHIILAILILTFGVAAIGIVAWIVEKVSTPTQPVSRTALGMLVFLVVVVLLASIAVAADSPFFLKSSGSSDKKIENVTTPTDRPAPEPPGPKQPLPKSGGAGTAEAGSVTPKGHQLVYITSVLAGAASTLNFEDKAGRWLKQDVRYDDVSSQDCGVRYSMRFSDRSVPANQGGKEIPVYVTIWKQSINLSKLYPEDVVVEPQDIDFQTPIVNDYGSDASMKAVRIPFGFDIMSSEKQHRSLTSFKEYSSGKRTTLFTDRDISNTRIHFEFANKSTADDFLSKLKVAIAACKGE